jgi:rRNA-processing protein FCF1
VVADVRERLAASKRVMQKFHVERCCLKKLKEAENKERYQVKIRFTSLENFDADVDISRTYEDFRENIDNFSQRETYIITNRSSVSHG